jgi:hypothetical protein
MSSETMQLHHWLESGHDGAMVDFKHLKKGLGPLGFLSDILQVCTTNWGVIVSALLAFGAVLWQGAYAIITNTKAQVFGGVFLWSVWTYIGLSLLYRFHRGIRTSVIIDYSHAIIVENLSIAYDEESESSALQVCLGIRNVANGPIKIEVQEFRNIIDGRTIPDSPVITMIAPRMGPRGIMSGTFKKDAIKDRADGHLTLLLHYGPPDGPVVRKFKLRAKITLRIGETTGVGNMIESEEDSPL